MIRKADLVEELIDMAEDASCLFGHQLVDYAATKGIKISKWEASRLLEASERTEKRLLRSAEQVRLGVGARCAFVIRK